MPDIIGDAWVAIKPDTAAFEGLLKSATSAPLNALESAFGKVGKAAAIGIAAVGGAAVAAGAAAVKLASDYDTSLSSIAARAGITKQAAEAIGKAFLTTAGQTTFSAQSIADAFAPVSGQLATVNGSALDASQSLDFMRAAMADAEASGASLGSTTADLASILQAFQLPVSAAASASDILWNTANTLGLSLDDVTLAVEKLHTKLGVVGGTLPQVATLFEDLATHGLTGQRALLAVSSAADHLLSNTPEVSKVVKDLGLTLYDATGNFVGFGSIIGQLAPKLAGMSVEQRKTTEDALLGKGAFDKLDATIMAGLPGWDAANKAVTEHGAAQTAAEKATANFKGALEKAKSAITDAGISIGTLLLPYVTELAKWLGEHIPAAINTLHGWIDTHRGDIAHWAGVIKDVLVAAFNTLRDVIGHVMDVLIPLGKFVIDHKQAFIDLGVVISGLFVVHKVGSAAAGWVQGILGDLGKLKNYIVTDLGGAISSLFSGHPLQAIQSLFGGGGGGGGAGGLAGGVQKVWVMNWEEMAAANKIGPGGIPTAALPAAAGGTTLFGEAGLLGTAGSFAIGAGGAAAALATVLGGFVAAATLVGFITGHLSDLDGTIGQMAHPATNLLDHLDLAAGAADILRASMQKDGSGRTALAMSALATSSGFMALSAGSQAQLMEGLAKALKDGMDPAYIGLYGQAWEDTAKSGAYMPGAQDAILKRLNDAKLKIGAAVDAQTTYLDNAASKAGLLAPAITAELGALAQLPKPTGDLHTDLVNAGTLITATPGLQDAISGFNAAVYGGKGAANDVWQSLIPVKPPIDATVPNAQGLLGGVTSAAQASSLLQGTLWNSNSGIAPLPGAAGSLSGNTNSAAGAAWNVYGGFNAALGPASQLGGRIQGFINAVNSGTASAADLSRRLLGIVIPSFLGAQHGTVGNFGAGTPMMLHGTEAVLAKDRTEPALWEAVVASIRGDRSMQRGQQINAIASQGRAPLQQGQWQVIYNLSVNGLTADEVVPRMRQEVEQSHARLIRKLGALR